MSEGMRRTIKPTVVSIGGKARSGKDFFAFMLAIELSELGYTSQVCHIATALKAECRLLEGWNCVKDEAGRSLLQRVGMERRAENPLYWIEAMEAQFGEVDFVLVPDTRLPREITYWKDKGYGNVSILLKRLKNGSAMGNNLTSEQQSHITETALDDWQFDHALVLEYGVEHLEKAAHAMARTLVGRTD